MPLEQVPVDLEYRDSLPLALRSGASRSPARRGGHVRRTRRAGARPERRAPPEGSARTTASRSSSRATGRGRGRPRRVRLATGPATRRAPRRSRGMSTLSEDLRGELAGSRPPAIPTASPSSRGCSTSPVARTCGGEARSRPSRRVEQSAIARRASPAARVGSESDPHLSAPRVRRSTRYQLHVEGPRDASLLSRGTALPTGPTATRTPASSRRPSDARAAAVAYLRGALLGGGSVSAGLARPHLEIRTTGLAGARVPRGRLRNETVSSCTCSTRGSRHAVAYAKEPAAIADLLSAAGASGRRPPLRGTCGPSARRGARREPTRERRPRGPCAHRARSAPPNSGGATARRWDGDGLADVATGSPGGRPTFASATPLLSLRDLASKCSAAGHESSRFTSGSRVSSSWRACELQPVRNTTCDGVVVEGP